MADFPTIPTGKAIPLVDTSTWLFPAPTMTALSATFADKTATTSALAAKATPADIAASIKNTVWTTAAEIGLVGNGNTATATANDAALAAFISGLTAKPGSFGATVCLYIPAGMYYIKNALVFDQRILIVGAGRYNTVLRRTAGASGAMMTFQASYSGISDIALEGGRYQNTGTPGMDGLVVDGAYFSGRDLAVNKHTGWGLTVGLGGAAIGCQFRGVQMRSNLKGGVRTISGSGSTDCQWNDFDIGYMGGVGIEWGEGGQEFDKIHVWSSGMEDPTNNSGMVVTSSGNRGRVQSEKNNGYGIEIRASDQEIVGRVWGNVKSGVFGSGATRVDLRGLAVYRNCVGNTTASTSTAFTAISIFNCLEWTMPKHVWDNANALASSAPPGEPAPTYPYPGKPAAFTQAWAVVETGTSDYNSYVGCIMKKQYTLGSSTNYPVNFTGSTNQGVNNQCEGLQLGLADLPTQTVSAGIVRVPAWSDSIKVIASATITTIAGNRPGRKVTIIFNGSGTGSVSGATILLSAAFTPTPNDTLTLEGDGTNWYEKARSIN